MDEVNFHWVDYLIFAVMLAVSLGIGVYFAVTSKNQTPKEYLLGGHNLSLLPVVLSMVVSGVNPNGILGFPAETYLYGPQLYMYCVGIFISNIVSTIIYVPLFYKLRLTSTNEYYALRYRSKGFERFITIQGLINTILIGGAPVLATASSFGSVTAIPTDVMIVMICVIATFYTAMGGLRGVVWADVFQGLVLIGGMCLVLAKGTIAVGGWGKVWEHYFEWERTEFVNWSFDPTIRYTFWSVVIGSVTSIDMGQASYMRMCSQPTLCRARWSVMLMTPVLIFLLLITLTCGVVAFAYYASIGCDPIQSGAIPSSNQILPYIVQDIMSIPGIPGAFMAALLASLLTTLSSVINAWVALFLTMLPDRVIKDMSPRKVDWMLKLIAVAFGFVYLGSAFLAKVFPATVKQITAAMGGSYSGAVNAVRMLAATLPWIGMRCTLVAFCIAYTPFIVLSVGASLGGLSNPPLPTPTEGCFRDNFTTMATSAMTEAMSTMQSTTIDPGKSTWGSMTSLSFMLYDNFSFVLCYLVGLCLSFIPYFRQDFETPDAHLLPVVVRWNIRRFCSINQSQITDSDVTQTSNGSMANTNGSVGQLPDDRQISRIDAYDGNENGVFNNLSMDDPPPAYRDRSDILRSTYM